MPNTKKNSVEMSKDAALSHYTNTSSNDSCSGIEVVEAIAYRKNKQLSSIDLPDCLVSIGDAAFSFCESLKQISIPASVECIGVAAFCMSGLETVAFEGMPREIENKAFHGCQHLKKIIVPKGCKAQFVARLGVAEELVIEESNDEIDGEEKFVEVEETELEDSELDIENDEQEEDSQEETNSIIGKQVVHKKSGVGNVDEVETIGQQQYLYAVFGSGRKRFQYPEAFDGGYLVFE